MSCSSRCAGRTQNRLTLTTNTLSYWPSTAGSTSSSAVVTNCALPAATASALRAVAAAMVGG